MNITREWDGDDHRTIRVVFGRGWGSGDFMVINAELQQLLDSVDHKVAVIFDFSEASVPASLANLLPTLAAEGSSPHPNRGMIVVVGTDSFLIHLWDIFKSMYRQVARRVIVVTSLEDAYARLEEHRAAADSSSE